MELKVFPRPAVAGELKHFTEARLHTDLPHKPELKELQVKMTKSVANPIYLVVDPRSKKVIARFDGATLSNDQPFIDFLKSARQKAGARPH
jgi:hypothetical protein